jgi:hypothetical protein
MQKVRKTLISTIFCDLLFDIIYEKLKAAVNVPSKGNKQKTLKIKNKFLLASRQPQKKKSGSGSESKCQ